MKEIKNALIVSANIGINQGKYTFWLRLDYGDYRRSFGGYIFRDSKNDESQMEASLYILRNILFIVGVDTLALLKEEAVRAVIDKREGGVEKIQGIGHIFKESWFFPSKELFKLEGESSDAKL